MELHFKYFDKLRVIDAQLQRSNDEEDEDEIYLKRLEGGLFTLQLVDYIILEVCASGAPTVKQRVLHTLNLRGGTVKTIREIMRGNYCLFFFVFFYSSGLKQFVGHLTNLFCALSRRVRRKSWRWQ